MAGEEGCEERMRERAVDPTYEASVLLEER
jgi:hypothetical protein